MNGIFVYMFCLISLLLCTVETLAGEERSEPLPDGLSEQTQLCVLCHRKYTPGIVEDWLTSRHSKITPEIALAKPVLERRISSEVIPESLRSVVVGCYECHGQNPSAHKDNFDHFGFKINVVVSPNDCKTCHPTEVDQYSVSKKANALDILQKNPLYHTFVETITGLKEVKGDKITPLKASEHSKAETCYACHGTLVTVNGMKKVSTEIGVIEVPALTNWPNQGVGRINPDGSRGACTPCHARHSFSIEIARKPYTCSQCHLEPDVPAFNVYQESKHGNIFSSKQYEWNWNNVPWRIGKDFKAPTCATCHNSLITTSDGKVVVSRTHDFGSRLWVRIFGLIYSHPQPKDGRTYLIKNKDGLPIPTAFTGELASEYLIDKDEQLLRQAEMKKICQCCHNSDWVNLHFSKFDSTIAETDKMSLVATQLLLKAWNEGLADPSNPFDEMIEHKWMKQWFFYANSIRYASAMGGSDYASFKNGWWYLTTNLEEMLDLIQTQKERK
ncbi:MAG: cytochrome c3 family protein [Candidatus Brocadia sp.]|nr:cytochrome c3 family protein [Candidatus Brocadia sp.]